jgi:hypothetical protein
VGWWPAGSDTTRTLDFLPVGEFYWRVAAQDPQRHVRLSEVRTLQITTATGHDGTPGVAWVRFLPPSPNPFNPAVRLGFSLSRPAGVELTVFDVAGRRIFSQPSRAFPAGDHSLAWRGLDARGREVSSGVYLARLTVRDGDEAPVTTVQRLSLVR